MTEYKLITSLERRRRRSAEEKKQIIEETYLPGHSVSQIARKYDITPSQLFLWRRLMEKGALQGISSKEELVPKSQLREMEILGCGIAVWMVRYGRRGDSWGVMG